MMYSDLYTKQSRFQIPVIAPILIGIFILSIVIWRQTPAQNTKANTKELVFVQTTNVFPHQITIIWQTDTKTPGWLLYGSSEQDLSYIALDERDNLGTNRKSFEYHIATLKDLKENTRYFFSITNGKEILQSSTQSIFTVKTINAQRQVNNLKPAYGKVVGPSGTPAEEVIVVLSARNMYPLASVSKSSGEWLIPLNYSIDKNTTSFRPLSPNESITLYFFSTKNLESKAIAKVSQLSPLSQSIELGKTYTLTDIDKVLAASDQNTKPANPTVEIIYPKNNAVVSAARPIIKGTGVAGNKITLSIVKSKSSQEVYKQSKTVAKDNTWNFDLAYIFEPATYVLSVTTQNTENKQITLSKTFSITKSGEQVLAAATPSATLTPTAIVLPTYTPTPIPTQITQATIIPSPTAAPPVSGGGVYPLVISSIALILFGIGLLVVF